MTTRDFRRTEANDIDYDGTGAFQTVTGREYSLQRLGFLVDETVGEITGTALTKKDAKQIASRVEKKVDSLPETTGTTTVTIDEYNDESVTLTVRTSELAVDVTSTT